MLSAIKSQLIYMISTLNANGKMYAGAFVQDGLHLLYLIFAIAAGWLLIESMIDGHNIQKIIARGLRLLISFIFVFGALNFWTVQTGGTWLNTSVIDSFVSFSAGLSDRVSAVDGGSQGDAVGSIIDKMGRAVSNTLTMPGSRVSVKLNSAVQGDVMSKFCAGSACSPDQTKQWLAQSGASDNSSIVQTAATWLVGGDGLVATFLSQIIMFAVAFILIICTVTMIFAVLIGDVMTYVGLTFGPILLPFLLVPHWPMTRQLPTGWFEMALGGAFYKAVAILIVGLAGSCLDLAAAGSVPNGGSEAGIFMTSIAMIFFAWLLKDLLASVGTLASKLTGGAAISPGGIGAAVGMVAGAAITKVAGAAKGSGGGGSKSASNH